MVQKLNLICLRLTRHSDRHSILSAYSLERGPVGLLVPAGNGRQASRVRALVMPLSLIECQADVRPGRSLVPMRDPSLVTPLSSLRSNPMKIAVGQFLAEVLSVMLREAQPDPGLFSFVAESVEILDALPSDRIANFHLCFLYRLSHVAGVGPDLSGWTEGSMFDLREGRFSPVVPLHPDFLPPEESRLVTVIARLAYPTMHLLRLSREQRNRILDIELRFLSIHYSPLSALRSPDVLRSLF